jgi:hypothetical protein
VKNRMREICTSGSVGGEGGNILAYPAIRRAASPKPTGLRMGSKRRNKMIAPYLLPTHFQHSATIAA